MTDVSGKRNQKKLLFREIIQALDYCIIVLDSDGTVDKTHSVNITNVLDIASLHSCTLKDLFRLDDQKSLIFRQWFTIIKNRSHELAWDKLVKLAPVRELTINTSDNGDEKRYLALSYKRITLSRRNEFYIVIVVSDITDTRQKNLEIKVQEKKYENEVKTLLGIANTSSEELVDFMDDTKSRLEQLVTLTNEHLNAVRERRAAYVQKIPDEKEKETEERVDAIYIDAIYRNIHTVKGNSATYGFDLLATYAHAAEDILELLRAPVTVRQKDTLIALQGYIEKIKTCLADIREKVQMLYGKEDAIMVQIPKERIATIHTLCDELKKNDHDTAVKTLIDECLTLSWKPLNALARKYQRIADKTARKLNKQVMFVAVNEKQMFPPDSFSDIDDVLTHIIINCLDHGIEDNETRLDLGKGGGVITLSLVLENSMRKIIVTDDGKGVDTQRLITMCIEKKIITPHQAATLSKSEKLQLMFHPGISTASKVTTISGRGVGMDVVKEKINKLQGTITIESVPGKGTSFIIEVPLPL